MRSRLELGSAFAAIRALACAWALTALAASASAQGSEPAAASAPPVASPASAASSASTTSTGAGATAEEVGRAIQALRDEQHFGKQEPERYLRFKDSDDKPKKKEKPSDSPSWLVGLFDWINRIGRVAIWTIGAVIAALLVVVIIRAWHRGAGGEAKTGVDTAAPDRVRHYDIRPDSLPPDVGGTAWAQWQAGDLRGALVLLYRGALSRLVHGHAVPIRGSSTEGECKAMAERHLGDERSDYFARVTHARLQASYAGRWPTSDEVRELCQLFDMRLRPKAPDASAPGPHGDAGVATA